MSFTMSKLFSFGEPPKNQHHCFPRFPPNWLSVPHHRLHFRVAHAEYPVVGFLGALKQWFLRAQTQAIVNSLLLCSFTTLASAAHDANSSLLRAASTAGLGSKHTVTTQLESLGMRSERAVSVNFGVTVMEVFFFLFLLFVFFFTRNAEAMDRHRLHYSLLPSHSVLVKWATGCWFPLLPATDGLRKVAGSLYTLHWIRQPTFAWTVRSFGGFLLHRSLLCLFLLLKVSVGPWVRGSSGIGIVVLLPVRWNAGRRECGEW